MYCRVFIPFIPQCSFLLYSWKVAEIVVLPIDTYDTILVIIERIMS